MTALAIERLRKTFHDPLKGRHVHAIDDIDLRIDTGEFVSLLGPSGCGKTTTLRCIAGFETPDDGAIRFDGNDVVHTPPERRDIGLVFQNYALFPHMTVAANVGFGLRMRHVKTADAQRRIAAVLDMVQLSGMGGRYPRQLSGGQQQRVALARALVIEPRILLLDEPLANLDARLRDEMRFFIRSLQQRLGITTVYVTHDQAEAMVMSDRIVVMFGGMVSQFDKPETIYSRPASRQVADFVGLSNFIPGRIASRESQSRLLVETGLGVLHCECAGAPVTAGKALVVLRPEAVSITLAPRNAAENQFPAEISERHYLGHATDYRLACRDGSTLQVLGSALAEAVPGREVWCSFPPDRSWLIPAAPAAAS
jgi:putative spermidine/putrescine transport system ATP-binding protein